MIKITTTRQCSICQEWSGDSKTDWKFACHHTPDEYRQALDELMFKIEKDDIDHIQKLSEETLYIVKQAEREK